MRKPFTGTEKNVREGREQVKPLEFCGHHVKFEKLIKIPQVMSKWRDQAGGVSIGYVPVCSSGQGFRPEIQIPGPSAERWYFKPRTWSRPSVACLLSDESDGEVIAKEMESRAQVVVVISGDTSFQKTREKVGGEFHRDAGMLGVYILGP